MSGRDLPPGLPVLRSFVAAHIGTDGLRETARRIGVRPYGLQYFVEGGNPHARTLRKLENWYAATAPAEGTVTADDQALVALRMLIRDLPANRQPEARRRAAAFFGELYDVLGTDRPAWLAKLGSEPER
jgi:ADP-ribose pyrophosphatase YjhB (NUDIX family)